MAHDSDLPCEGDGNCMACKKKPPEYEIITCKTCVTPWHMTCLSVPPETLADAACWECPDCSFLANSNAPPASVAVPGRSELISAIGSIDVDRSLTEQEKAKRRQELLSGGIGRADDKSIGGNHEDVINGDSVLHLFQESLSCSFCMQLPERPITTPCGHNFCLKCFQKWVRQGKRTCANCRRAIPPEMVINPQINSSLVIAIRIAKMSKSNPSRRPQKVYNFVHSQNPPDKSYSTKHAKKALKEEFCSGKDFVTFPPDHFGPISAENGLERKHGVLVGETWENWMECRCWGVHLPHVDGAQSVALFGGNEDDEDHGKWFLYTGSGGRDLSGNKRKNTTQLLDQKIEKQNEALRESCQKGYPIRVVRVSNQKILHQADVCLKTSTSSIRSKTPANLCRQHAEFEDMDKVMVSVGPEHCLGSKYNRLQNRNVGPFKILHKINPNIYLLDLPDNMGITKIFNSEDLTLYQKRGVGLSNYNAAASHLPPDFNVQDEIEDIVDMKIVATSSGGYKKYLVKWRNKPWSDCTWVCDEDFQQLDCGFYEKYRSFNLSQLSFSKTGRDESHIHGRFGKYYKRKGYLDSEVNMIFFDRLQIEKHSSYSPDTGIRYDGIYRIEKCWVKICNQGYKVCRYLFIRCDNDPAPWTSDDHGDWPGPLPDVKELKDATDITERKGSPSWDFIEEKGRWMWTKPPPVSRKQADIGNLGAGKSKRKFRHYARTLSVRERLLTVLSCLICHKVMVLPLTTPCAHNFCKSCLEGAFAGQTFIRHRKFEGWRTLRAQKNIMKCPTCSNDIFDFLQNPQVNRELMNVVKSLQRENKETEENVDCIN